LSYKRFANIFFHSVGKSRKAENTSDFQRVAGNEELLQMDVEFPFVVMKKV
jgi:hypothetical protein